jgi:2-oxoglutarate dehydrogenase E2 component (dihydrolipoamide succinyltransferase)
MSVEIRVPPLGESVVEATVGRWLKQEGQPVAQGEVVVELETDKINVEVAAPQAGTLSKVVKKEGDTVGLNELLAEMQPGEGAPAVTAPAAAPAAPAAAAAAAQPSAAAGAPAQTSPAARAIAAEAGIDLAGVQGTGPNARVTKQDAVAAAAAAKVAPAPSAAPSAAPAAAPAAPAPAAPASGKAETRERMSRRRQTIARRLVEAQQGSASLTTFNEVDMSTVMKLRKERQDAFVKQHGIKLGFMSFFTKAVVGALKQFPRLNAEIQGDEMVMKQHYDIGIAVGAEEGLVVPVMRDADKKGFAQIEKEIAELGTKARDGKLTLDELQGGTFTLTNGGIFGSMLSTPILNTPQVGILGMHNIVERPVAVNGQVEIRPIMYIALTYDHRIVDGSEAVRFLVAVKRMIEDPVNLLFEG